MATHVALETLADGGPHERLPRRILWSDVFPRRGGGGPHDDLQPRALSVPSPNGDPQQWQRFMGELAGLHRLAVEREMLNPTRLDIDLSAEVAVARTERCSLMTVL
ncbi:MAG: hypothetical protein ACM4AI_03640 [Acidobacteriota bacterium]